MISRACNSMQGAQTHRASNVAAMQQSGTAAEDQDETGTGLAVSKHPLQHYCQPVPTISC